MKKPKQLIDLTGMEFLTELNKVLDAEVKKANAELADEGGVYHPEDLEEEQPGQIVSPCYRCGQELQAVWFPVGEGINPAAVPGLIKALELALDCAKQCHFTDENILVFQDALKLAKGE